MSRPTIANLSIFQALGLLVSAGGGSLVWFAAATLARPADLGALGRVASTSALVAGLVTAGLGQFLLTIIRSSPTARVRAYLWMSILAGAMLSALVAGCVGAWQSGRLDLAALATGLLAGGIAVTNIQDALYLGVGLARDVPAKGAAIVLARLVLLACALVALDLTSLLLAFVISQLGVALGWLAVRGPGAFQRHQPLLGEQLAHSGARGTLAFSYLYSISAAAILTGVPALVTSLAPPERAGAFFLAWTVAGVLSGISVAVANSVLAVAPDADDPVRQLARVLVVVVAGLCAAGALVAFVLPDLLVLFSPRYRSMTDQLAMLAAGQIAFGGAIVSLAVYRALSRDRYLIAVLVAWPLLVVGGVALGLRESGVDGGATGFMAGNLIAAVAICPLAFRVALAYGRGLAGLPAEVMR
ncbi:MAG TPA: hypothetical protein VKE41_04765 [Roseiflexaceae bacterium]|nr:hypothetical protein [Roseiflexaceae bacterium]